MAAYSLANYAAACKVCNSVLKSDAFPIDGVRGVPTEEGTTLRDKEKPFLCYPIGRSDADPETLIEFVGTIARPAGSRGRKKKRGQVIIKFFRLNDRDELQLQRAEKIVTVGNLLEREEAGIPSPNHERLLETIVADNAPHAACVRAFFLRWADDREFARSLLRGAEETVLELGSAP